jgi:hypothetical protein
MRKAFDWKSSRISMLEVEAVPMGVMSLDLLIAPALPCVWVEDKQPKLL